jgi:hypothetical protein
VQQNALLGNIAYCDVQENMSTKGIFTMKTYLFTGLLMAALSSSAYAQSAIDLGNLKPEDAARLNQAVQASDTRTQEQFQEMQKQLKDAGHPSGTMLEMTQPKSN